MKKITREYSIQDNIIFLGNRNDIDRLYQAMDIFVLPSRYEGLPVVGVEAQVAGLPCILSDKITEDTEITKSVEFMSIKNGQRAWAERILKRGKENHIGICENINVREFDIEIQSENLFKFYKKLYT